MEHPMLNFTSLKFQQQRLLDNLSRFYFAEVLCDVIIKLEDASIPCHRVVLAASSPYFRAMFAGAMSESHKGEVNIQGVEASALQLIIEYLYTSHIEIDNENVQTLFSTAHLLQLDDLCTACAQHMQAELDVSNCVRVYQFASLHSSYALLNAARTYLLQRFQYVNANSEFMELDHVEVDDILCDDNLNISDEYTVFETIMNWIQHDMENRKQYCQDLLKTVRFSLLDPQLIDGIVSSLECLKNGALLSQCLMEINKDSASDKGTALRIGMYDRQMIVFAGGSQSKHTRSLSCYDPQTRRNYFAVQPYVTFDFKFRIDNHKLVVTDNNGMYLIGGIFFEDYHFEETGVSLKEVKCFDPFRRCWENKAPMLQPRCAHGAIYMDNHIYAIGGKSSYPNGTPLSSVERYSCTNNQWQYCSPLPVGLAHHGAVAYQNSIYVVGGYLDNTHNVVTNALWQYDAESLQWTELATRMLIGRAESGVALVNESLYVVGGDNGQFKVNQTECFNLRDRVWKFGPDFPEDRKSMGAIGINGCVYICGGTRTVISRINRTPRVVEARDLWKLDSSSNNWVREAKLVQYANSYGCAVGTVNLRRITESEFISSPGASLN